MTSSPWEICKLGVSINKWLDLVEKRPFLRIISTAATITDRRTLRSTWNFFCIKFCIFSGFRKILGWYGTHKQSWSLSIRKLWIAISGTFPPEIGKMRLTYFFALEIIFQNPLKKFKNSNHRRSYDFLKKSCKNAKKSNFSTLDPLNDVMMTS